jgi:hypothetical protein
MNIDQFSDTLLAPILADMLPMERKKMLLLQRLLAAPVAYAWLDKQLPLLDAVAVDPDWIATIKSDPGLSRLRSQLARWAEQQNLGGGL